jgi:hypothetical protein
MMTGATAHVIRAASSVRSCTKTALKVGGWRVSLLRPCTPLGGCVIVSGGKGKDGLKPRFGQHLLLLLYASSHRAK